MLWMKETSCMIIYTRGVKFQNKIEILHICDYIQVYKAYRSMGGRAQWFSLQRERGEWGGVRYTRIYTIFLPTFF